MIEARKGRLVFHGGGSRPVDLHCPFASAPVLLARSKLDLSEQRRGGKGCFTIVVDLVVMA